MFEQLTLLAQQFGFESVVRNNAIPNEQNELVINEASNSVLSGLQKMVSGGGVNQLLELFQGNNSSDNSNPVVQKLLKNLLEI